MNFGIRLLVLPVLLLAFVIGCGKGNARSSEVSGKVTYKGQPVTGGNMTFFIGDAGYPVTISPDGTYSVSQLPEGEATVVIDNEQLNPKQPVYGGKTGGGMSPVPEGRGGPKGTYVALPAKYKNKDKTDLKVPLKTGKQEFNLDLKD